MIISPRYVLSVTGVVAGGFLAVSAMSFSAGVAGWLGFGVSAAVTAASLTGAVFAQRSGVRAGYGILALVGFWSLVAALAFHGTALTWLVFANALALGAVAIGNLTAHELGTERVVHALEVRPLDGAETSAPAHRLTA